MRYSIAVLPFVMVKRVARFFSGKIYSPVRTFVIARLWRIKCGKNVRIVGQAIIRSYDAGAITLGDNVVLMAKANHNLVGLMNPTVLCANKGGRIVIGSCTGLSSAVINARELVEIGKYVNIGGNVRIFDNDFHSLEWQGRRPAQKGVVRTKPVIIEDDCFIGTNAIILKGTHIGARSIVAAGSVVFGLDIPADSMVKGNPAVICRSK